MSLSISITAEAYEAIKGTLPGAEAQAPRNDASGGVQVIAGWPQG